MAALTLKSKGGAAIILRGTRAVPGTAQAAPVFSDCDEDCCNGGRIVATIEPNTCVRWPEDCSVYPRSIEGALYGPWGVERVVLAYEGCEPHPGPNGTKYTALYVGRSRAWCESGVKCGFTPLLGTPTDCETMLVETPRLVDVDAPRIGLYDLGHALLLCMFDFLETSDFKRRFRGVIDNFVDGTPYPGNPWDIPARVPRKYRETLAQFYEGYFAGDTVDAFLSFIAIRDAKGFFDVFKAQAEDSDAYSRAIQSALAWVLQPEQLSLVAAYLQYMAFPDTESVLENGPEGVNVIRGQMMFESVRATVDLRFVEKIVELKTKEVCNGVVQSGAGGGGSEESGWPYTFDSAEGSVDIERGCGPRIVFSFTESYGDSVRVPFRINADMAACCSYDAQSVFVSIVEGRHLDGVHFLMLCPHGAETPDCLFGDLVIVGSFPSYELTATCCCWHDDHQHNPVARLVDGSGAEWDGATLTLEGGVVVVTPRIPITISVQVQYYDGTEIAADQCNNIPAELTASVGGTEIRLALSGSTYVGSGYIDCAPGTPSVSIGGGGGDWETYPTITSAFCDRYHGWTATGVALPRLRTFDVMLVQDDAEVQSAGCNGMYPAQILVNHHEIPNPVTTITVCDDDPSSISYERSYLDGSKFSAVLTNPENIPHVLIDETNGPGAPYSAVWTGSQLVLTWRLKCDEAVYGTIRVKLNGGRAAGGGSGFERDGYYVIVAPIGEAVTAPAFMRMCFTPSYANGETFPATMPSGTTALELLWTGSVSVSVSADACAEPAHSFPHGFFERPCKGWTVNVTSSAASDVFCAAVRSKLFASRPGSICGVPVTFAWTGGGWSYSGPITTRDATAPSWSMASLGPRHASARTDVPTTADYGLCSFVNFKATLPAIRGELECGSGGLLTGTGSTAISWSDPWLSKFDDGGN